MSPFGEISFWDELLHHDIEPVSYTHLTQMEVSAEIGISQAQVSRLEKNALRQIRKEM